MPMTMFRRNLKATLVVGASLLLVAQASAGERRSHKAEPPAPAPKAAWFGDEMPLPLAVRSPQDLAIKALAERQYLVFNLLAGGKLAFDEGRFAIAADKWEALLRLPGLDPEIDRTLRPLATEARAKAGVAPAEPAPAAPAPVAASPVEPAAPAAPAAAAKVIVAGTVAAANGKSAGGTVLWLKRTDGPTPRPAPARGKVITQKDKTFVPRVLAVPVGTKVGFRNEDDILHNVFSLSRPNNFDTGLYKTGATYTQTFAETGVVQLLCNIHASMLGYVYVVDSPWFAQASENGAFVIKGVPPGEYDLHAWNENSAQPSRQHLAVGPDGAKAVEVRVTSDKARPNFVPDKYGKPRQMQLGY